MKRTLLLLSVFIFSVAKSQNFTISASQQPKCFGDCDGSITFTTSAVNGTFTAVVSNGSTCPNSTVQTSTMNAISIYSICPCAANYTFTIYNASMAVVGTMVYQFPIYATSPFTVNTTTIGATSCFTCCDGYAYLTSGGGNPNGTPTFSMDGQWITGTSPASSLCVGVHTVCARDLSDCIACKVFTVNSPAGVQELSENANFSVYPNPASDQIFIDAQNANSISRLQISDVCGKIIESFEMRSTTNHFIVDTHQLRPGMYYLQLYGTDSKALAVRKFCVIR